jgi:DNA-binding response OmpR family regulator
MSSPVLDEPAGGICCGRKHAVHSFHHAAGASSKPELQPMNDKPRILVIDDDEPILGLMRNVLREFDFEAMTASTGPQALDHARQTQPDLVLLDKNMPGMSGAEVIRAFRAEGWSELPILILSGEPLSREELGTLGANGAVQKPFDLISLITQIRTHLGMVEQSA